MTIFLRLLAAADKENSLADACRLVRSGSDAAHIFQLDAERFSAIPGKPFAYWTSASIFAAFRMGARFQNDRRKALRTNGTTNDPRWIRAWWEVFSNSEGRFRWIPHAKGGAFSPFYSELHLVIGWDVQEQTYPGYQGTLHRPDVRPASLQYFFQPGLTWSRRNSTGLSFRILPANSIFGDKGPAIAIIPFDADICLAVSAVLNSVAFRYLVSLQLGTVVLAQSYEAGIIQNTPFPELRTDQIGRLAALARRAWALRRSLDTTEETSHAFLIPKTLRYSLGCSATSDIHDELARIQAEIDAISFDLYDFSEADRAAAQQGLGVVREVTERGGEAVEGPHEEEGEDEDEDSENATPVSDTDGLLTWAAGVAFGRFDWRMVGGERNAPPDPAPFDPLPSKSPGMLPDGATPFHDQSGILVDDQGHKHDLPRLIEEVLALIQVDVPGDVRRWLRRDFFPLHLKQYSKSRRKAPIYWPLSTSSGGYTLWLYYPNLTSQTLYTAINDFVDPKLKQVSRDAATLRDKGAARSREDEKALEALQTLELELIELRDTLLQIAPTYRPNHDDGVQITAAPLWQIFRHKPWQKILQDTWAKLKKGDYDWAHLAMAYWPERVREKCRTDKSLAIAHDLERLYEPPAPKEAKFRRRKKAGDA